MMRTIDMLVTCMQAYSEVEREEARLHLHMAQRYQKQRKETSPATLPTPLGVAGILVQWHVPPPLVWTIAYCTVLPYEDASWDMLSDKQLVQIACQLIKLFDLLTAERLQYQEAHELERHMRRLCRNLLTEAIWPPGLLLLLVALFLDTLQQAKATDANDRERLAIQAHALIVPLCEQMGLWEIRREVKEVAFACSNPPFYQGIGHLMKERKTRYTRFCDSVTQMIGELAKDNGMTRYECQPNTVHRYKIAQILQRRNAKRSQANNDDLKSSDLAYFIVLLPDDEACHVFFRILQKEWSVSNYQNFLDHPKTNGYQALQMQVEIPTKGSVMFYLQTSTQYKKNTQGIVQGWIDETSDLFVAENLLLHPPHGKIIVFQKYGKSHLLPLHASPLDLAAQIGTPILYQFTRAYRYGIKHPIDAAGSLENGDIVKIDTARSMQLRPEWQNMAKTSNAQKLIAKGLSSPRMPLPPAATSHSKDESINQEAILFNGSASPYAVHVCHVCKPFPPRDIVGYLTIEHTLTLHIPTCHVVANADEVQWQPVQWNRATTKPIQMSVELRVWDKVGLLGSISQEFMARNINIIEIRSRVHTNGTAIVRISPVACNPRIIDEICISLDKHWWFHGYSIKADQYSGQVPHLNPYTFTPATQGGNDPGIFYGRADELREIYTLIKQRESCRSVILWGQQRIGKSTLLASIAKRAPDRQYTPVLLSTSELSSTNSDNWLGTALEAALDQLTKQQGEFSHKKLPDWRVFSQDGRIVLSRLMEYLDAIQLALDQSRLVLMIDEFQALTSPGRETQIEPFIQQLREIMEQRGIACIFAGWGVHFRDTCQRWFQPLCTVKHLDVLDKASARALICKPVKDFVKYEPASIDRLLFLTQSHPFFLTHLCRLLVNSVLNIPPAQRRPVVRLSDVDDAANRLVRSNTGIFNHLVELDDVPSPVSQRVCRALVNATTEYHDFVPCDTLVRAASLQHLPVPAIARILHEFVEVGVLEQKKLQGSAYRIHLPLLYEWIKYSL